MIYIGHFVALTHAKSVTWSERQFVYDAALERDYPSPRAAQGRAQLYLQNGQLAPALQLLQHTAQLYPDNALTLQLQILYTQCVTGMPAQTMLYERLAESTGREVPIELSQALNNVLNAYEKTRCEAVTPERLLPAMASAVEVLRAVSGETWHIEYYIAGFYLLESPERAVNYLEELFRAGQDAAGWMLGEILKEQPGIEIGSDTRAALAKFTQE